MKLINAICLAFILSAGTIASASVEIACKGTAEFGEVKISNLVITEKEIVVDYIDRNKTPHRKKFKTVEYMQKNGKTDINEQAYFIGGSVSGDANDYNDISIAHYGKYQNGLGSDIAFSHEDVRYVGDVQCEEK